MKTSSLRALRGHEKKSKNHQNYKFCLNEIKYLQLLIFAKRDFFSRPQSSRRLSIFFSLSPRASAMILQFSSSHTGRMTVINDHCAVNSQIEDR